ncbi:MAG: DUF1002 domain-containing protein [Coprothermobacter sp.]|nr:DUF1002 domain-containing protein [Coprothermobacter sp.]
MKLKWHPLKKYTSKPGLVNETGESGDSIAQLISEVKNRTEFENINDTHKIKQIVSNTADKLDINLTSTQIEDISQVIANSQKSTWTNHQHQKSWKRRHTVTGLEDQLYSLFTKPL